MLGVQCRINGNGNGFPVLLEEILKDLSSDQKYLYEMIHAIQRGRCESSLASKKPGPLNNARFLTLACRILRLYAATENPSNNLIILTNFVVRIYGPM